jgi:hypothetical protein
VCGGRLEATPPWEPISAALAKCQKMDPQKVRRLVKRKEVGEGELTVGEHGRARASKGEPAHLALVSAHPARASQRVRAARVFISPKQAGPPIYSYLWGYRELFPKTFFFSKSENAL